METGRPLDPAFDLPVLMVSRPSLNFGIGDQLTVFYRFLLASVRYSHDSILSS